MYNTTLLLTTFEEIEIHLKFKDKKWQELSLFILV